MYDTFLAFAVADTFGIEACAMRETAVEHGDQPSGLLDPARVREAEFIGGGAVR